MMSCARIMTRTTCLNCSMRKLPSSSRNFRRLMLARLQAESSRCMYSEHGLLALMRPVFGQVCESLIVVSNCMPGSPQCHVASAMSRRRPFAFTRSMTSPVVTALRSHSSSASARFMSSSVARTELLAFWKKTEPYASPSIAASYPRSMSLCAFSSSFHLQRMNWFTSGWSALRTTILAARRVLPPDLMTPAEASAARIKETGPDGVPPPASRSREERSDDTLSPEPEPYLKIIPSFRYHSRIDSMLSSTERMKQALHWGARSFSTPTLNQTGELNEAY